MTRSRLRNRRSAETFTFEHSGVRYVATVGRFGDGSLSEIFINAGKLGSSANVVAHDAAVLFSIARQHGVPLETITASLAKLPDNSPAGPLGMAIQIAMENG